MTDIVKYPDPRLQQKCEPITNYGLGGAAKGLSAKWSEMYFAMTHAGGVGLAGPQIGWMKRAIVVKTDGDFPNDSVFMLNPLITFVPADSKLETMTEGCLSIPNVTGEVERHSRIRVRWRDLFGKQYHLYYQGALARVIQHEIDHLDGILFTTKITRTV